MLLFKYLLKLNKCNILKYSKVYKEQIRKHRMSMRKSIEEKTAIILRFLKDTNEEMPTGKIANRAQVAYWTTENILRTLFEEGKIKMRVIGNATYWRVK